MGLLPELRHRKRKLYDATPQPQVRTTQRSADKQEETDSLTDALKGIAITDREGLQRAYDQGATYTRGDTLYIAGSHTAKDWYDDFTKVPFYGDLRNSTRYQEALQALKANPNIKRAVGHSLGGSVALELQKNYPGLESRTYGAPVWDPFGTDAEPYNNWVKLGKPTGNIPGTSMKIEPTSGPVERYRNIADPFSIFDGSATNSIKWNPFDSFSMTHDYSNIADKFKSGNTANSLGYKNQDGSISLNQ